MKPPNCHSECERASARSSVSKPSNPTPLFLTLTLLLLNSPILSMLLPVSPPPNSHTHHHHPTKHPDTHHHFYTSLTPPPPTPSEHTYTSTPPVNQRPGCHTVTDSDGRKSVYQSLYHSEPSLWVVAQRGKRKKSEGDKREGDMGGKK